jgi:hypothetical protein
VRTLDSASVKPHRKVADPFYSSREWRTLLARVIARRGRRCETCGRTGCRIFGDHIEELQDGGARLDEGNVRLLCGACHTTKTAARRRDRALSP